MREGLNDFCEHRPSRSGGQDPLGAGGGDRSICKDRSEGGKFLGRRNDVRVADGVIGIFERQDAHD